MQMLQIYPQEAPASSEAVSPSSQLHLLFSGPLPFSATRQYNITRQSNTSGESIMKSCIAIEHEDKPFYRDFSIVYQDMLL
jgi:hypothetical protein